eukprot:SAG31_NODE_5775_length_2332_cov_1.669503_3_plen_48_part_00
MCGPHRVVVGWAMQLRLLGSSDARRPSDSVRESLGVPLDEPNLMFFL